MSDAAEQLDATSYRQRVLATLLRTPALSFDDPFFLVDLDPSVEDEERIRERLRAVVALWNKERSPNYKPLAAELARRRGELEAVLLDPTARAAARVRVTAQRAAADVDSYRQLDALGAQLVARYQGLPRSRLSQLAAVGRSKGLPDDAFADWVARHRVIEDDSGTAEPLAASVRRQIRAALDEFGRLTGALARAATLYTVLEVAPTADSAQIAERHAQLATANQLRQHDRLQTVTADLLASVKTHLVNGDRASYGASLVEDAKDQLRDVVAERVIVDGELSAADFETCVRTAMGLGYGLSSEQARTAVRQLATALGASVVTGPAVEYVVCPSCRAPQPRAGCADCRYCGTPLFRDCPSCGRSAEAALAVCPLCGASFRAIAAAETAVAAVRSLLAAGRPAAAQTAVRELRRGDTGSRRLGEALERDVVAVRAEVEAALAGAAREWRAVERDLADRRLFAAVDRLSRLTQAAADLPGPGGASVDERLADLAGRKAALQSELVALRARPPAEHEAALAGLLVVAADNPAALDLLSRIPLAPPDSLRAEHFAATVRLRWQPGASPGPVRYKVTRISLDPAGTERDSRVLGTVAGDEFEDAGVAGGDIVRYDVQAVAGRRTSTAASTAPALFVREVTGVSAIDTAEGVALRWAGASPGTVVVERSVDVASAVSAPMRRARGGVDGYLDGDAQPGVLYHYRVYAEYRDLGGAPHRTAGSTVSARLATRPRAVTDLYAVTTNATTRLSWATPPAGEVRVFAAAGPLAPADAEVELGELARHARFVGAGRRRTVDTAGRGLLTYTPVTVDGERAVVGLALAHLCMPGVRELAAVDTGTAIRLTFALPTGVTEAYVCARRDRFPAGPDDPAATRSKVTNTALELGNGFVVDAPADGGGWFFSVHPLLRDGRDLLAAPVGAQLAVRTAGPAAR